MSVPLINVTYEPAYTEQKTCFSQCIYEMDLQDEAEELWEDIHQELQNLMQLVNADQKSYYRNYTSYARQVAFEKQEKWLKRNWPKYAGYFAQPTDVDASKIQPRLELINEQRQRDIFRIARLFWSLPYSNGYGRRMGYLIWDDSNDKLMGILGLQSPPLSLALRDKQFKIPKDKKTEIVNQTMDAYTVGALPPYADLLAGKLVVLAAASKDVREDYQLRYEGRKTIMENRVIPAVLIAVTTLSAFGRSSLYNRVSKGMSNNQNIWAATSLGFCEGWGTLHFSDRLYEKMKNLHKKLLPEKRLYGFGTGPKIRLQVVRHILETLGFPGTHIRHNIKREAFIIPHVKNLEEMLSGIETKPVYDDAPFSQLAEFWKERYCLPRAEQRCSLEGRETIAHAFGFDDSLSSFNS